MNEIEKSNMELEAVIQLLSAFEEDDEEESGDNEIQVLRLIKWLEAHDYSADEILQCVKYVLRES